jgi:hypothetical protein
MRSITFILPALAALTLLTPTVGHADSYPWCAQYGRSGDGGRNCGFVSFAQCMDTVRGIGGFCERNQFYTAPERPPTRHKRTYRG